MKITRLNKRGKGLLAALVATAALVAVGAIAYKSLFSRPGEAAIQLVPSTALVMVTIDANPSPSQVSTFREIESAIGENGIQAQLDNMLKQAGPALGALRSHLQRSYAFAMLEKESWVILLAVDDAGAVENILKNEGKKLGAVGGRSTYEIKGGVASVIGDYLVVSSTEKAISTINDVRDGRLASMADDSQYKAARAALAPDSNLMVFAVADRISKLVPPAKSSPRVFQGVSWYALGSAIRPGGIETAYRLQPTDQKDDLLQYMLSLRFDGTSVQSLPSGAVILTGAPKLGGMLKRLLPEMAKGAGSDVATMKKDFYKQSGLDLETDVLDAAGGDASLAVYLSGEGQSRTGDLLVRVAGDGPKLKALLERVKALAEKSGKADTVKFVSETYGDATIWRLDPTAEAQMRKELGQGLGENRGLVSNKTLCAALRSDSLYFSTSMDTLRSAIDAATGKAPSIASDPAVQDALKDTSEMNGVFIINQAKIMGAFAPEIRKALRGAPVNADDLLGLFGDGAQGSYLVSRVQGNAVFAKGFLPLDYKKLFKLIGDGIKASSPPSRQM